MQSSVALVNLQDLEWCENEEKYFFKKNIFLKNLKLYAQVSWRMLIS